jgi:hypothetical protein
MDMLIGAERDDEDTEDEAFLRQLIRPEEDRRRYGRVPWVGGYRWFRSPNVVPIEQYRSRRRSAGFFPKKDPPQAA